MTILCHICFCVSFSHKIIISYTVYKYIFEETQFEIVHSCFQNLSVYPVKPKGKYSFSYFS
jgi:hypothetical protein